MPLANIIFSQNVCTFTYTFWVPFNTPLQKNNLRRQEALTFLAQRSILTYNSDGAGWFIVFCVSLAVLKPLNDDGVRRTDRLTGEREGSVSRNIHVTRLYGESRQTWIWARTGKTSYKHTRDRLKCWKTRLVAPTLYLQNDGIWFDDLVADTEPAVIFSSVCSLDIFNAERKWQTYQSVLYKTLSS